MAYWLILIAEDDEHAIESWGRDIREFSRANNGAGFEAVYARTKSEALKQLSRTRFDCAVIDLRLPDTIKDVDHDKNATGNEVVAKLLEQSGIPAVVYSGHIQEAEEFIHLSNIKIMAKERNGQMAVLMHLASFETLMAAMGTTQSRIAAESAKLFHRAIWPRWDIAWTRVEDANRLAEILTRQIVSQVAESLGQPSDKHHPEEVYLLPPIADGRIGTGDMVEIDAKEYVVVTPRCNLARNQCPANLMLALCEPIGRAWATLRADLDGTSKQQTSAASRMHDYATQNHAIATHFLPPSGDDGPWLVQFANIIAVPSTSVTDLLKTRKRSIAAQFVPNLVQRYAAYLGRIGQPDLDESILAAMCRAGGSSLEPATASTTGAAATASITDAT